MDKQSVLIVGGHGVVGRQIAEILHARYPDLMIILGGRTPGKAAPFGSGKVHTAVVDNNAEDPLMSIDNKPALIVNAVNDLQDRLLLSAVRRSIPLIDITRWTSLFRQSVDKLHSIELRAPVVMASGWMAGTAALFAKLHAQPLRQVEANLYALYSLKDKAGPDSTAYMDRMTIPFPVMEPAGKRLVYPMSDPVRMQFPNGYATRCYRLDTPDHETLLRTETIASAGFRIAFDSKAATQSIVMLIRSGIWKMISGERFRGLRRGILYNPGTGSAHHIRIVLKGLDAEGNRAERNVSITDPLGQTHLTALGAAVQAEKLLRRPKERPPAPGIYYPEDLPDERMDHAAITGFYEEHGVKISWE